MVAYRFCRPDDIPRLVEAVNRCYGVHFRGLKPLSLQDFQTEIRELNVWPSNCMIASQASEPIAVCIATKRETSVLIHRVGVSPDHLRQGHGQHLLNSLSNKLAVLGPDQLVAEVPADWEGVCDFFASAGYRREDVLTNFELKKTLPSPRNTEAVIPVSLDELDEAGLLSIDKSCPWERQRETLENRRDQIKGSAVVSPDGYEAFLMTRENGDGTRKIDAFWSRESKNSQVLLALLLGCASSKHEGIPLTIPKLRHEELDPEFLIGIGFRPGRKYIRWVRRASPG